MICQRCRDLGMRSKIYVHEVKITCIGDYYDEDGKFVRSSTPNIRMTQRRCSNDHWLPIEPQASQFTTHRDHIIIAEPV